MSLRKQLTVLYVGGLAAEVTEEVLHAAFIPFGDLKSIQIAKDYVKSTFSYIFKLKLNTHLFYLTFTS